MTASPGRIALAFILAPMGGIALAALCAAIFLLSSGSPAHDTVAGALDVGIFALMIGGPIAYAVQALLMLLLGAVPPAGWRGLVMTASVGSVAGAITLGAIGRFGEHALGAGVMWLGALGCLIGGSAAVFYVVICCGVPRAKPAV